MKYINLLFVLFYLTIISCEKDVSVKPKEYPFVVTEDVTENDSTGVTLSAKVLDSGAEEIIDYGFILKYDNKEYKFSIFKQSDLNKFQLKINTNLEKQKDYIYRAYIQTTKHTVLANEVKFNSKGSNSPKIFEFFPVEGFDSTLITIKGSNFGYTKDELKAFINGIESKIEYFSDDTLKIRASQMAYYGNTNISLKLGSKTIISDKQYKIIGPNIDSISNTTGYSGDYLTISGKYLTKNGYNLEVLFDTYSAEIIQKSENRVDLVIPPPYNTLLNDKQTSITLKNGLKFASYNGNFLIRKSWIRKQDPPFAASWYEKCFTYNKKGYFLNINEKKLFEYDPNIDNWSSISTYPGANNDNNIFVVFGDKFFKIGGYNYLGKVYEFWEYDFLTKVWKQRNNIPFGFYNAASFILNNTLFIITDSEQVWVYNYNTDSFTQMNNFPENLEMYISFVAQNNAYIVNSGTTWEYNSQNDSWTFKSTNPFSTDINFQPTIGFDYKGTGYVLQLGKFLYKYDLQKDIWIYVSLYPEYSSTSYKSAFVIADKAYIATLEASTMPYPRLYSYEN